MEQTVNEAVQKKIELRDVVYAPLHAISYANIQLSSDIVKFLAATGDPNTDALGKTTINLRTVQMMYEQVVNDANDNTVSDSISLEVPLLSIYPLSTLKISKSKVSFSAEVREVQTINGHPRIMAELAGSSPQRAGNCPGIHFEVELEGVPAAEGLARFVDTLNSNAVPKQLSRRPLDEKGNKLTGADLQRYEQQMENTRKQRRMQAHLAEADEMIRLKNSELKALTGLDYEECTAAVPQPAQPEVQQILRSIADFKEIKLAMEQSLERFKAENLKKRLTATNSEV